MEQLERIFALSLKQRVGILVGVIALLLLVYWYFIFSSLSAERDKVEEQLVGPKGLREQVAQLTKVVKNLPKFKEQVERLDAELAKALSELPDKREMDMLLAKISDKASDAGLEVRGFTPKEEVKRDFYAEQPVFLEVSGSYHQMATFFDEVGRLDRIVNLAAFQIKRNSDTANATVVAAPSADELMKTGAVSLQGSITATAFRFLEPQERPTENKPEENKRHRGRKGRS